MVYNEKKETLGKIFYFFSFLILIYMCLSQLTHLIYTVDEYFTLGIINLPFLNGITVMINDVHPPLYYMILKIPMMILDILGIAYDTIVLSKYISILAYLIIIMVSGTKIKNEFNWVTAGFFAFFMGIMSNFFLQYLTIRMYGWATLFILLSFLYFYDILKYSSKKSWALFTLFGLLSCYTHYFSAVTSVMVYLLLLFFIYKDINKLKKWILSVIIVFVGYLPWLTIFLNQLGNTVKSFWIPPINFNEFLNCIFSFATMNSNYIIYFISSIFLILIIITFILKEMDNKCLFKYIIAGIMVFLLTIIFGILFSVMVKPILLVRYLLPAVSVFWLSIAIYLGKIENKRLLTIFVLIIVVMGIFNFYDTLEKQNESIEDGIKDQNFLNSINNENTAIVSISPGEVIQFGTLLKESKQYRSLNNAYGLSDDDLNDLSINYISNMTKLKSKNDNIYLIKGSWKKSNLTNNSEDVYQIGANHFYKVS